MPQGYDTKKLSADYPASIQHVGSFRASQQPTQASTQGQVRKALKIKPKGQSTRSWLIEQYTSTIRPDRPTLAPPGLATRKPMTHTWILECLALYKTNSMLITLNRNPVGLWKTTMETTGRQWQKSLSAAYYTKAMHCAHWCSA